MWFTLAAALAHPTPEILGTLQHEELASRLASLDGAFAACRAAAPSGTAGDFAVKFVVSDKGTVTRTQVRRSTVAHASLPTCYADAIATLDFPTATVGIQVVLQPFTLDGK